VARLSSLVLIGSGCLICFLPLALYLLFLAFLNQRERATLVSGPWDFTCVLLGLSGFLLVGGPILLSLFDSTLRSHLFSGNFEQMRKTWDANSKIWSTIAASYSALLICVVLLSLLLRRPVTIVYNVNTAALEGTITSALDSLGLPWKRIVGGFYVGGTARKKLAVLEGDAPAETPPAPTRAPLVLAGQSAFLRFDTFPSFHHATLRWRDYDPLLRAEIETELDKTFRQVESPHNAAGGWLMTAAVSLFFMMLVWMGFLIYWIIRHPKAA
jgi:hypothetical protein